MRIVLRPIAAASLLLLAALPLAAAERTRESLMSRLPKYDPAQNEAARQAEANKVERPVAEEGVTILPEFKVVEKRVAQPDPDQWMASDEITQREVRRAEADMNPLEMLLNRWHIPLLMPSFAQRARGNYEMKKRAEEMSRLTRLEKLAGK